MKSVTVPHLRIPSLKIPQKNTMSRSNDFFLFLFSFFLFSRGTSVFRSSNSSRFKVRHSDVVKEIYSPAAAPDSFEFMEVKERFDVFRRRSVFEIHSHERWLPRVFYTMLSPANATTTNRSLITFEALWNL